MTQRAGRFLRSGHLPTLVAALLYFDVKDATGTYALGLLLVAGAFLIGVLILLELGTRWTIRWLPQAVRQSGVFCYRGVVRKLVGEETALI